MSAKTKYHALLVGPFGGACGIGQYSEYLWEALRRVDRGVNIDSEVDLHPSAVLRRETIPKVVILNYHAALLSQWHPEHITEVQRRGSKVLTIWHDSGVPNSDHCKAVCGASDHFVLHEPFDDLPAEKGTYLHHGVPDWQDPVKFWLLRQQMVRDEKWWGNQPVIGTIGLSLGYRNIDLLCRSAQLIGWGVLVIASRASDYEVTDWTSINPACVVLRDFLPKEDVISYLAGCDATAQLTVTNNAGVSGAIRQCIAARKPILAFHSRQFRDLEGERAIKWLDRGDVEGVAMAMENLGHWAPSVIRLAHRDSWRNQATEFMHIIRQLSA